MSLDTVVEHLSLSGFKVSQVHRAAIFGEGVYGVELGVARVDSLGQNVINIFNDYGWNVRTIHFYENGIYVDFVVKKEELTPTTYVDTN